MNTTLRDRENPGKLVTVRSGVTMAFDVQTNEFFEGQRCANCGVRFALTQAYEKKRRQDGQTFYCPNGHSLIFGDTELDKLRRERDRLAQRVTEKDDAISPATGSRRPTESLFAQAINGLLQQNRH